MKKIRRIITALVLCLGMGLAAVGCGEKTEEKQDGISVVATLFPQYDFAREIVGDLGSVTLLLDPGMESHSFDPSTADMVTINKADVFLYTGPALETWVAQITDSFDEELRVVDLSEGILETIEGTSEETENKTAGEDEASEDGHHHDVDPHIWTNPVYAMKMVERIRDEVCAADPENAEIYTENAEKYLDKLEELDKTFREIVSNGVRKEIVHGGRFALGHFAEEYGLEYKAAYDTCTSQAEPSAKKIAELTTEIEEKKIPVVFYEELIEPKVAESISETTGAKMLLLHSCHNVSAKDFESGVTYLQLMEQNAENLRIALN